MFYTLPNKTVLCPASVSRGHIVFGLSICLCVCLFVRKNFYIGHIFWLVGLGAFIFHMSIPYDKTFLLVPSSRSSVKVKYQGHKVWKKWPLLGNYKHSLFFLESHLFACLLMLSILCNQEFWPIVHSLPNYEILDLFRLKAFADDKLNFTTNIDFLLDIVENIVGKVENAGYQHFLFFLQCCQKASSSGLLKVGIVWESVKWGQISRAFSILYSPYIYNLSAITWLTKIGFFYRLMRNRLSGKQQGLFC